GKSAAELLPAFAAEDRDAVTILPRITIEEQSALFNRASIILFPSLSEGFGLALAEGMCFGLAAVCGATGFGADFLSDGVDARVVFPSTHHIAAAVLQLAQSPATRAAMAEKGREVARGFTLDRMADAYEKAFLPSTP
ncbi:MAG: glycosyltransferase family 4 protein, partial [Caulobacteraceae bacterium]